MRASETQAGHAWLENFAAVDRPAATMLIDSLRFASLSTQSRGLKDHLLSLVKTGDVQAPILPIPERALSDFLVEEPLGESPVAFDEFLPGGPMPVAHGSEGLVGRLLRDFVEAGSNGDDAWMPPDADLERLRAEKCRSIVIATDYAGSGSQLLKLADAIVRNRTIRSWRSSGYIRIHAVAFAATPAALERLRKSDSIDSASSWEGAPSFDSIIGWTDEARDTIRQLCVTEAQAGYKKVALGWRKTAGLYASEHRAPNNLPAVFWQEGRWRPLFPGKKVPPEVARQFEDLRPSPTLPELAEHVGQLRIGHNERIDSMPLTSKRLLRLLILLAQARRSNDTVAAELGIDVAEAVGLRESLERLELLDTDGHVTDRGRQEIDAQKRARRRTTADVSRSDTEYYPVSLRSGGGMSA